MITKFSPQNKKNSQESEIKNTQSINKLALGYGGLSLGDITTDEVENFNLILGNFTLDTTSSHIFHDFDIRKNTETLKKFIIYISTYINTDIYSQFIIDNIDKIDISYSKNYIDHILSDLFDYATLADFINIVKFIKKNKADFLRNQDKFQTENKSDVSEIFIKNSQKQKSFLNNLRNHSKTIAISLSIIPYISSALGNISEASEAYINQAFQNLSQTISLSNKEFGEKGDEVQNIYQKLSEAGVYDLEKLNTIDQLQQEINRLKLEKNKIQLEIEITKNNQDLLDTLQNMLSDENEDPIQTLNNYILELENSIINLEHKISFQKANIEKDKSDIAKNLILFSTAIMHHETGTKLDKSLINGVIATNHKDRNGLKSVGLFQANGKNPIAKIEKLAKSGAQMAGISSTQGLGQVEKQVLGFFGHMKDIGLGRNTKKVIKNIIKNNLLEKNIKVNFQTKRTNHKNTRNAILLFIKNYGEKYNIHNMISEYETTKSSNLLDKIMLNIVAGATNEFIENPTDNSIKNIVRVLASGTQVGCTEIGKGTVKNINEINSKLPQFTNNIAYANIKTPNGQ